MMNPSALHLQRRLHSQYCAERSVRGEAWWRTGSPVVCSSCDFAASLFFYLEVPWCVVAAVCVYFCDFKYSPYVLFSLFLLLKLCECVVAYVFRTCHKTSFLYKFSPLSDFSFFLFAFWDTNEWKISFFKCVYNALSCSSGTEEQSGIYAFHLARNCQWSCVIGGGGCGER